MSAGLRVENLADLARFDVPAELRFLEYRLAVAEDFEPPVPRRNQINFYTGIVVPELSRQTGGSGLVVSKSAVFDADFHCPMGAVWTEANVHPERRKFEFPASAPEWLVRRGFAYGRSRIRR